MDKGTLTLSVNRFYGSGRALLPLSSPNGVSSSLLAQTSNTYQSLQASPQALLATNLPCHYFYPQAVPAHRLLPPKAQSLQLYSSSPGHTDGQLASVRTREVVGFRTRSFQRLGR